MAATDDTQKQADTDMSEQMSSSDLETLVNLQEALDKLGPSEGDGVGPSEQETETMMVEEEQVLHDDPLLQGVFMGNSAEGEVITGDMEEDAGDEQPTYLLVQQPGDSSGNESITEARTADGTIIHLRQITTAGTIQGIQGLKPLQPSGIKRPAPTTTAQQQQGTVTKVIISGGNITGGVSQPMVLTSAPPTTQTIKVVASSAGTSGTSILPNNSRTITLAQAQQMGLLGTPKLQQLVPNSPVKQNILLSNKLQLSPTKVNSSPKITLVQQGSRSPTKILPAPGGTQLLKPAVASVAQINSASGIGNYKTIMAGPQKVIIRQAGSSLQGLKQGAVLSPGTSSQIIRIPATQNIVSGTGDGQGILQTTRQYLRLVTSPQSSSTNSAKFAGATMVPIRQNLAPAPVKMVPIAPATTIGSGIRSVAPKTPGSMMTQKIMIPSASSTPLRQVSQGQVTQAAVTQLGGTLVPTAGGNFMVLPAQVYDQLQSAPRPVTAEIKKEHKTTPRLVDTTPRSSASRQSVESNGIRPRKPCNCTKSQCLKLYCDCFANGEFCNNCNCNTCFNNLEHEEDRQKAIRACLERNPQAFKPKIGKTSSVGDERRHNKGCNCRRSGCLKNYCECYEAKIPCTHMCKCIGCRNVEDNDERKIDRENIVLAAGLRARQQHLYAANRNRMAGGKRGRGAAASHGLTRQPFGFMNQRLVEATCQCLLAQAKQGESAGREEDEEEEDEEEREPMDVAEIERRVLEEYGECLKQFIECSTKLDTTL